MPSGFKGGTVDTQVNLEDGSQQPLLDHLREVHHKGTNGLSEEYLGSMHRALHGKSAEELEHSHPETGSLT